MATQLEAFPMRQLALGLLVWLAAATSHAADLPEIQARGTLRVLVVDGSPAFFALGASSAPGLDRELLGAFAHLHKLTLVPVQVPGWSELVPALLAGRGDVIAGGVTVTPARSRELDFSAEVFPTRNVVVTRRPTPVVTTIEELRRQKLGTIRGTSMAELIASLGLKGVDDSIPSGGAPAALREGRITATVSGIEDALLYRAQDPEIQIGMFLGAPGSLAYGVRKDAPRLLAALDDYIGNVRRTATWSRLVLKYFGASAPELLRRVREE
jgi:peptidoglycan lytic transglycosylase F